MRRWLPLSSSVVLLSALVSGCSTLSTPEFLPPTEADGKEFKQGIVYRDYWLNVTGNGVEALRNDSRYPTQPDGYDVLTSLKGPINWKENFGARVEALITPPATGSYTFYITSDDYSELWLSNTSNPDRKQRIAAVPGAATQSQWNKYPEQISASIYLEQGKKYYLEVVHKEGRHDDHFSVAWEGAGTAFQVIGGQSIAPYLPSVSTGVSEDFLKGYTAGYRVGYDDASFGLAYNTSYPPKDTDKDGIPDNWEIAMGLDPNDKSDGLRDFDNDLLSNFDEYVLRTLPNNPDSDNDGIPDGHEVAYGLNPLLASDAEGDIDGDGVSNVEEYIAGSDLTDPKSVPVTADEVEPQQLVSGLIGQYFNKSDLTEFVTSRLDERVYFWWSGSAPIEGMNADNFSVRWTGKLLPTHKTGRLKYTFFIKADDAAKLWIDNQLIIDLWNNTGQKEVSATYELEAGRYHDIRLEYRDDRYGAMAYLSWQPIGGSKAVIPPSALFSLDLEANNSQDSDNDGMADVWELKNGLQVGVNDASAVLNSVGATALTAYQQGLDPWTGAAATAESGRLPIRNAPTLSWTAPTSRVDGASLYPYEIDKYELSYGTTATSLNSSFSVPGTQNTFKVSNYNRGTYYFNVKAVDTNGVKSQPSTTVTVVIP